LPQFVTAAVAESSPWEELKAQCILGGREFIQAVSPRASLRTRSVGNRETPVETRGLGYHYYQETSVASGELDVSEILSSLGMVDLWE
jgi:hypothetical protein